MWDDLLTYMTIYCTILLVVYGTINGTNVVNKLDMFKDSTITLPKYLILIIVFTQ